MCKHAKWNTAEIREMFKSLRILQCNEFQDTRLYKINQEQKNKPVNQEWNVEDPKEILESLR